MIAGTSLSCGWYLNDIICNYILLQNATFSGKFKTMALGKLLLYKRTETGKNKEDKAAHNVIECISISACRKVLFFFSRNI